MHRRLRELPIAGGASTAACAYYDETLKEYGLRSFPPCNGTASPWSNSSTGSRPTGWC